ncbi:ABC transporter permease [bacterium]|nr:ABC transporter permease [bacterium]
MIILETIALGINQLRAHKLRAMLSILGILISVGSVTGIISLGDGLRRVVTEQFQKSGGPNNIQVRSPNQWYRNQKGRWVQRNWEEYLENRDIESLRQASPHVEYVVPIIYMDRDVRYHNATSSARIRGSNEHHYKIENWEIDKGRYISEADVISASKVAVLGSELAKDLYGSGNPIGKELKISGDRYMVIGVLKQFKFFGGTNERHMIIPYTTAQKRIFGNERINRLFVYTDKPENVEEVAQQLRYVMRHNHIHADDFEVSTGESQIEQFNRVVFILKAVAGGIAAISLLVGGIGIMNIMLVSVTERTREIGIRKALGAKRRTILFQFILEAVVLCLFGGGLGILFGIALGKGLSKYIMSVTPVPFESIVSPGLMMFAVIYSAVIGLFFGVYPAYRASKMDPIKALSHE